MNALTSEDSVTRWCLAMKAGDESAAHQLWQTFFHRLVDFASRRLSGSSTAVADEEDIALSAFKSFCFGIRKGRFGSLTDRESLWRLLVVITARKAVDHVAYNRRQKRSELRNVNCTTSDGYDDLIASFVCTEPTPALEVEMAENLKQAIDSLEQPELKQIAIYKLDGFTNQEIAQKLHRGLSTIERKLRTIRGIWSQLP